MRIRYNLRAPFLGRLASAALVITAGALRVAIAVSGRVCCSAIAAADCGSSVGVRGRVPRPSRARVRDPGAVAAAGVGAVDRHTIRVEPQRHRAQPP